LIIDVVAGLRQIAALDDDRLIIEMDTRNASIGLDHAIALALYLAVLLPPYLDRARDTNGSVTVTAMLGTDQMTLTVRGSWNEPVVLDFLRSRLMRAYAEQLEAQIVPGSGRGEDQIRFSAAPPARDVSQVSSGNSHSAVRRKSRE
jgi:hypothetical protein